MIHPSNTTGTAIANTTSIAARPATTIMRTGRLAGGAVASAWLVSIMYHLVLFAIMYALPWLTGVTNNRSDVPVPFTSVVGDTDKPVVRLSPPPQLDTKAASTEADQLEFRPEQFQSIEEVATIRKDSGLTILGIGTGGGDFNKYGFKVASSNAGPDFFGLGGQARGARRIVYVVDRSGSMMTTLHGVISELKESIGRLRRTQKFHVVFFNSGTPLENPPKRLVSAIQAHKREAFRFFDGVVPGGSTDPKVAMRRAFSVDPDLIYFLTDGEFDERLLQTLDGLNRGRRVRIFTIAYVSQEGAALLERIAREHNGEYRFVSEDAIFP